MCTETSPSELALIFAILGGPLAALPIGLGIVAWRKRSRGWAFAASAASALPGIFLVRNGAAFAGDAASVAIVVVAALALVAWALAGWRPSARHVALALTVLAPALLLGMVAYASATGPTCAQLMAPPTPTVTSPR